MAKSTEEGAATAPKIKLPGTDKEVSVARARKVMAELTEESAGLRDDDSGAAKHRRTEIARQLRAIQNEIDKLDEMVEVEIPIDASPQFPFRVGQKEFWPGVHTVPGRVAQTLRYMMDQHRRVEGRRLVAGGNTSGYEDVGRTYPPRGIRQFDERGVELPSL